MATGSNSGFQKGLSLISAAKTEDAVKRERLELLLSDTAVCLNGMEENIFSIINGDFLDVQKTIEERIKRLQERDYYILVAGETSSGKSSLINLLLGVDLLPSSVLSTTSTICELKYGELPTLVAHFTNRPGKPPLPPKAVKLLGPDACDKSYRDQIAPYVHVKDERRENESIYEKVEIFWPHELLQVGVVIIDSPGVGESEKMDQILMSYLPKAFAFIYVISSTNAGGIQKDRLVKILDKVRRLESDEIDSNGLAECALFIINKWDQVPERERCEVKRFIVDKLTKFWPDGNPCEQTVYISTNEALAKQECGELTEEFVALLEGVNSMVLKAINGRLTNHWTWANDVLGRIIYRVEGFNKSMLEDRESLVERMNSLFGQIQMLKDERKQDVAELEAKLEMQREKLINALFDYLNSPEFHRKFTSWEACDIPAEMGTWKLTKIRMKKALEQRFERFLTEWEGENGVHAKLHDELVQCFLERFRLAEADLRDIENAIHSRHSQASSESADETPEVKEFHFTIRAKVIIGATSPLWITLGVASLFVGLPVLAADAVRKSIRGKMAIEKYRKDRNAYLTQKSEKFLASVSKENVRSFVNERMHASETLLEEFVSRIPRILEANERMVLELMYETRSNQDVWSSNLPILRKCLELQNMLSKFGLLIWPETIRRDLLTDWSEDENSCIGVGEFSSVYSGILAKGDTESSEDCCPFSIVAVKVFKKPLDSKNAKYFMKNEAKLRELRHQNVRRFHGALVLKDFTSPDDSRIVLVMEMLLQNLRSVIFCEDFTPPANAVATESSSIVQFLQWATQIADGLAYIHGLGLIHKHLKLENILVGQDENVKLSDIGITAQSEVSERSMIYAAPEILQTSAFSSASDVYSLGLVLWEMWYGIQVFSEIFPLDKHKFLERIVSGYRPQKQDCKITLPKVQTVIHYCWAGRKEMRLKASQCHTNLVGELKGVEIMENM